MYCTNCGAETNNKICSNCGVKQENSRNYCKFCGEKIDNNCKKCPSCGELTSVSPIYKILNIIKFPVSVFFIIMSVFTFISIGTLSEFGSVTLYTIFAILMLLFTIILIVIPSFITKKNNSNGKSIKLSFILTISMLLASIICWCVVFSENERLNTARNEAEINAQLEADFSVFENFFAEGQYEEALAYTKIGDFEERAKGNPLYDDYCNYAKGMIAYKNEPYNKLYDALVYFNSCEDGFLEAEKHIADIKKVFSDYVGIYEITDSTVKVYMSITENGDVAFVLEDDYKTGNVKYLNRIYRENIKNNDIEGWSLLLTGTKYIDGEFKLTYDYNMYPVSNTTDVAVVSKGTGSDFGVYAGKYKKISDTPLADKSN